MAISKAKRSAAAKKAARTRKRNAKLKAEAAKKKRAAAKRKRTLAAKKGVVLPDDIEGYEFSDEERAKLESEKHGFIDRIFFTLREEAESLAAEPEDEPPAPTLP